MEVMGCCQYPVCLQQDKYVQSDFFNPNFVYTVCIPFLYHPYAFRLCSGHDCGVYVMVFMDILSIKTDGLYFDPHYVWHMRDLCLLSIVDGEIAQFLEAIQGMCMFSARGNVTTNLTTDAYFIQLQGRMRMFIFCLQHGIRRLLQVHMFMCILHMH